MEPWVEIVRTLGAPVALGIFFLIRLRTQDADTKAREDRMAARLDEQQDRLIEIINKSNESRSTNAKAISDLVDEMRRRPCMATPVMERH